MNRPINRYTIAAMIGGLALSGSVLAGEAATTDRMDTNTDGKVSQSEYQAAAKASFDRLDANRDGKVTATEMDAAYAATKPGVGAAKMPSSAERIKTLDTDGDGSLTASEHDAGSRTMFEQLDADKDGSLSTAEIKAGHEALMSGGKSY